MAVYFLANFEKTRLKIGFSGDPLGRTSDIIRSQSDPSALVLMDIRYDLDRQHEVRFHRALSRHHIHGEWFSLLPLYRMKCVCGALMDPVWVAHLPEDDLVNAPYECRRCGNADGTYWCLPAGPIRLSRYVLGPESTSLRPGYNPLDNCVYLR